MKLTKIQKKLEKKKKTITIFKMEKYKKQKNVQIPT